MPIAAIRVAAPSFPMPFALDESRLLAADRPIPDQIQLSVRLDVDGDPMTKSADDFVATLQGVTPVLTKPVTLVLRPAK